MQCVATPQHKIKSYVSSFVIGSQVATHKNKKTKTDCQRQTKKGRKEKEKRGKKINTMCGKATTLKN